MTRKSQIPIPLEPERYELGAPASYVFESNRREFFKFLGTGVFIACAASKASAFQESGGGRRNSEELPREIDAWLHIGEDGGITVFTGKVEVGQNIRTSLTQAVAEELKVSVNSIRLVMGDTQLVPFDMGTFGSRTTPVMNLQLRRVSAAARDTLVDLAAKQWSVDRARLMAREGQVFDPQTKRSLSYGQIVKGQQITQMLPAEDPLSPASDWKIAGQPLPKVNGRDFVTGKHRYPSDETLPGMLYGKVARPTAFNATLVSAETQAAEQLPGVTVVRDGNFVGVAAPTSRIAEQALSLVHLQWKAEPQPSNAELFE
jgi:isoquinoline 1-oxidoreductase